MKRSIFATVVLTSLLWMAAGCSGKAAELYDTARFEEVQNNREHAVRLYEEIQRRYPDSEYAAKARQRLAELKGGGKQPQE